MISEEFAEKIVSHIPEILDSFGVKYRKYNNRLTMPCPIHGGDNENGCSIFTSGKTAIGNWKCWTHECEAKQGKSIINFLCAMVKSVKNENITYKDCVKWMSSVTNHNDKEINREIINFAKFIAGTPETETNTPRCSREVIRKHLQIPSSFFIEHGYSREILDRYDVGLCMIKGHEMYNRVVAPVYNNAMQVIGCVGRTIQPKCKKCNKYHYINRHCPQNRIELKWAAKWINSSDFHADICLYNYWYAKQLIEKSKIAILVEGQGDVWRLEEAKIRIGLGLFGCDISDEQVNMIVSLPVKHVVLVMDNDEAGRTGEEKISEKLKRYVNIHTITPPNKDLGDMSPETVRSLLIPTLEKLRC